METEIAAEPVDTRLWVYRLVEALDDIYDVLGHSGIADPEVQECYKIIEEVRKEFSDYFKGA